ncbi:MULTISPECIES: hypothetical protein [Pseudomonas]|uniref:hypothetical protein n=1 Tax=Pseudomonas TaxID=286 RepID=UPI002DBED9E6|nr:hypothetical protein [Pseudomonas asiatica]MEB6587994.1 hypothetical protein [Pseudomonas asiatica]
MSSGENKVQVSCRVLLWKLGLCGLALGLIWMDIAVYKTKIVELSFVEVAQEMMLFMCAVLYFAAAWKGKRRGLNVLVGGFFSCLLMRELDGLLDPLSHSAWCWPFIVIAFVSLSYSLNERNRQATMRDFACFSGTHTFGAMTTGLSILLFSRVFGMGELWHLILGEGYVRLAKTTVEEGIELLAYSVWLAASIESITFGYKSVAGTVSAQPRAEPAVHRSLGRE